MSGGFGLGEMVWDVFSFLFLWYFMFEYLFFFLCARPVGRAPVCLVKLVCIGFIVGMLVIKVLLM